MDCQNSCKHDCREIAPCEEKRFICCKCDREEKEQCEKKGIKNIEEGMCDIRKGLNDIKFKNKCECACDIKSGVCSIEKGTQDIEKGLCSIEKCLKDICCDNKIQEGIFLVKNGLKDTLEALRDFRNCNIGEGTKKVEKGLSLIEKGLCTIKNGFKEQEKKDGCCFHCDCEV